VLEARLAAGSADVVICFKTSPHFPDPDPVIAEFGRWLKPEGRAAACHDATRAEIARHDRKGRCDRG